VEESSESLFQSSCAVIVRTIARKIDEIFYLLTDKNNFKPITNGAVVRVYDAVLYRFCISE
jgi:hypothetical protein